MFGKKIDRSKNVTCDQNAQFFLTFLEEGEWRRGQEPYPQTFRKLDHATPEDVRKLQAYLNRRLDRVAGMMEILDSLHNDWAVTCTKEYVKYETVTMDFKDIIPHLLAAGYTENDYLLEAEYTRKWGMI
jgi:hypothetical protein